MRAPAWRSLDERLSRPEELARLRVVCLPDFFLDHFVPVPAWSETAARMKEVHDRGGGNIPTVAQGLQPGGNAANTALALARLGVSSALVTRTDPFGARYVRDSLGRAGVNVEHVRADGDLAVTAILEFGDEKRNVMLSYPGSVARFSFEDLTEADLALVRESDLVLVANWTLNREKGTDLAAEVFRYAKKAGVRTVLDTGDPSARPSDVPRLLERVGASTDLDVFGVNENELSFYAPEGGPDLMARGRALRSRVAGTVDLHTARFCASWGPHGEALVPTFLVEPKRATGAGDAWNAGNILGHLLGVTPEERLTLANAVAALYLASPDGRHPTAEETRAFLGALPRTRAG